MIVEFVGCTGAGKTTLISRVRHILDAVTEVSSAFELVAAPLALHRVMHPTAQNLIQEATVFPAFTRSVFRSKNFMAFAMRMLLRQRRLSFFTTSYLRSLERAIGVYELGRQREQNRIVLVDEGTILLAHNLFVYTDTVYTSDDIIEFGNLVPLPDLIVYVSAPVESLIERTLGRNDPPRETRSQDRLLIEQYIRRAVAIFDQLSAVPKIRDRILFVNNEEDTDKARDAAAATISAHILERGASRRSSGIVESISSTSTYI